MEETISQIHRGCKLAKELEANLPNVARDPSNLRNWCQEIAATFYRAAYGLSSQGPSLRDARMVFGETLTGSPLDRGVGGGLEGESSSRAYVDAISLQHPRAPAEDISIDIRGQSESTLLLPQLGLDVQATSSVGVRGFGSGPGIRSTDAETFSVGVGGPPVEAEGSGSGRRPETGGSSAQRSSRRRGAACRTVRVPALRTGSMDNPPDDGYTWRKYGQKDILGCKFPRSYYRCTHKNFYGCDAKKQVQRLNEDPYTYEVTYCGDHSCRTSITPLLPALPHPSNNPQEEALMSLSTQPPTSLSTSIQLGSWFSREQDSGQRGVQTLTVGSDADIGSSQGQGGRDTDCPVTDLADAMFNSGGSSSSMDVIFSSAQESWRGDREA